MPFGDSFPFSLLSFLIYFHLSLAHSDRLMQTASGQIARRHRRWKVISACNRKWHTQVVLAPVDSWRRVTVAHIRPFSTPLFPRRRAGYLEHLLWTSSTKRTCQSVLWRKLGGGGAKKVKKKRCKKRSKTVGVQLVAPRRWSGIQLHN